MKKVKDQPESEPAELASPVGERIRKIRKEEGLSLELFALRCDMNAAYVEHIERSVQNPTCLLYTSKDCGYQGGFIWDYIDQSIWKKDRYGKWFQAYGGDFGERPTDYNFSGNGIAYGGDRAPSPKMQEVKFCYQNIAVSIDNSGFEVWNKNLFTSTLSLIHI